MTPLRPSRSDPPLTPAGAGRADRRLRQATRQAATRLHRLRYALGWPGALAVTALVFAELTSQAVGMVLDSRTEVLGAIAATALVMLGIGLRWSRHLPGTRHSVYGDAGTGKVPGRRGLVLLAGLDSAGPDSPAARLLAQATAAEYLAVVGTPQTAERGVHRELVDRVAPAAGRRFTAAAVRCWEYGNAESIADAEQAVSEAIRWMAGRGLDPAEIVVDVSAGRRPMGYGAKDAADDALVETQYLAQQWDPVTNRPLPGTSVFKVIKTYHD